MHWGAGAAVATEPLVVPGAEWLPPPAGTTVHETRGAVGAVPVGVSLVESTIPEDS